MRDRRRSATYRSDGRIRVEGVLLCAEGSTPTLYDDAGTFAMLVQPIPSGIALFSKPQTFDDQLVCDGTAHAWHTVFDAHNPSSGQAFDPHEPLAVDARLMLANEPDYLDSFARAWDQFFPAPAPASERLRLDVTGVAFVSGALRVDGTVECARGYEPVGDPTFVQRSVEMFVEQRRYFVVGGVSCVRVRTTRRKDLSPQVICDGPPTPSRCSSRCPSPRAVALACCGGTCRSTCR